MTQAGLKMRTDNAEPTGWPGTGDATVPAPLRSAVRLSGNPEMQLLCLLGRPDWDDASETRARELLSAQINWIQLYQAAHRHHVAPILYRGLKRVGGAPEALMTALRTDHRVNAARALQLVGELHRLLTRFDRAGIDVLPFKGPVLAQLAYGDVALRHAGDLDLLVRREQVVQAADLLGSLGHQPTFPTSTPREAKFLVGLRGRRRARYLRSHSEHHLVHPDTGVNVDLHWAIALREFAVPLDAAGMWQRATAERVGTVGRAVRTLGLDDLLIVLCVNGTKDGWERLDRICDIAHFIWRYQQKLQFDEIFARASEAGARRMLCVGLALAGELMAAPLPKRVVGEIARDAVTRGLTAEIRKRLSNNNGDDRNDGNNCSHRDASLLSDGSADARSRARRAVFHLRARERWRDRARYCAAHLRPSVGDWACLPLPPALSFVHYLIRPFRLLGRYVLRPGRTEH
jgi:hypothetical protein